MDYSTLMRMEPGDLADLIQDSCYDAIDEIERGKKADEVSYIIDDSYGHSKVHAGQTIEEIFARMSENNLDANGTFLTDNESGSAFSNHDIAMRHILSAIAFQAEDIADWLQSRPYSPWKFDSNHSRYAFSLNIYEKVGNVYLKTGEEYDSSSLTVVIGRNSTGAAPLGFSLITAYPDLERAKPTGKVLDVKSIAMSDGTFKTPEDRIACYARSVYGLTAQKTSSGIRVSCADRRGSIRIDMYLENGRSAKYKLRKINETPRRVNKEWVKKISPMLYQLFSEMEAAARKAYQIHKPVMK